MFTENKIEAPFSYWGFRAGTTILAGVIGGTLGLGTSELFEFPHELGAGVGGAAGAGLAIWRLSRPQNR